MKRDRKSISIHPFDENIDFETIHETHYSEHCLDEITELYTIVEIIASGISATTIKVATQNNNFLAIKIMEWNYNSRNELITMSKLNKLADQSVIFNHNIGWIICHELPKEWQDPIKEDKENYSNVRRAIVKNTKNGYLCFLLELNTYSFRNTNIILNNHDIICFVFLLLHGILVARRELGYFKHRDIHIENIMFNLAHPPQNIRCNDVTITNVKYIPKLIDFGDARFEQNVEYDNPKHSFESFDFKGTHYKARNDITRIKTTIKQMYAIIITKMGISDALKWVKFHDNFVAFTKTKEYKDAEKVERNDLKTLEILLLHPYFDNIKTKPQELTKSCIVCNSEATFEYNINDRYKFCSKDCEKNSHYFILKHLIKFYSFIIIIFVFFYKLIYQANFLVIFWIICFGIL